jgi:hypothetical protein
MLAAESVPPDWSMPFPMSYDYRLAKRKTPDIRQSPAVLITTAPSFRLLDSSLQRGVASARGGLPAGISPGLADLLRDVVNG